MDPEGFAVLFDRHPTPLHRYIVTRVGRRGLPSIIDATTKPATTDASCRPSPSPSWPFGGHLCRLRRIRSRADSLRFRGPSQLLGSPQRGSTVAGRGLDCGDSRRPPAPKHRRRSNRSPSRQQTPIRLPDLRNSGCWPTTAGTGVWCTDRGARHTWPRRPHSWSCSSCCPSRTRSHAHRSSRDREPQPLPLPMLDSARGASMASQWAGRPCRPGRAARTRWWPVPSPRSTSKSDRYLRWCP